MYLFFGMVLRGVVANVANFGGLNAGRSYVANPGGFNAGQSTSAANPGDVVALVLNSGGFTLGNPGGFNAGQSRSFHSVKL